MRRLLRQPWFWLLALALVVPHPNLAHVGYCPVPCLLYEGVVRMEGSYLAVAGALLVIYWLILVAFFYPLRWIVRRARSRREP